MKKIRLLTADEIECRVGSQGKSQQGGWATLLLYKDARVDYKLLDEVFGPLNWQNRYEVINGHLFCTIDVWDEDKQQWVSRQNVGTESNTEAVKGEASDAFKRAAFALGIGVELYSAPVIYVSLLPTDYNQQGKIKTRFNVVEIGYDEQRRIKQLTIVYNNGEVRYERGGTARRGGSRKKAAAVPAVVAAQAVAQPVVDVSQVTVDVAVAEMRQATDNKQLLAIYNKYQHLQSDKAFVSALTDRKNELKSA